MCQADTLSSGFELFGDFDVEDTGPFVSKPNNHGSYSDVKTVKT